MVSFLNCRVYYDLTVYVFVNYDRHSAAKFKFKGSPYTTRGDSLIKVHREQNLARTKFLKYFKIPGQKLPQNLIAGQVFMNFREQKSEFNKEWGTYASLFHQICKFSFKKCQKPNDRAKLTFYSPITRQKLVPKNLMSGLQICTYLH